MADKKLYGVFFGPYLYEDDAALDDPDGDFSGMTWDASITDGLHLCAGVRFLDTDQSHHLTLTWNENDSGNRTLQFLVAGGNRSITLNENLVIADGYNFTLQALGQANQLTLNEAFTVGDGSAGTLTFGSVCALTVELASVVNQDLTTDAGPTFASCNLGTGELTAGSINRASGSLTLEIAGNVVVTVAAALVTLAQTLALGDCVNAAADVDKFLVLDASNNVDYRTGAEVLSDIGGAAVGESTTVAAPLVLTVYDISIPAATNAAAGHATAAHITAIEANTDKVTCNFANVNTALAVANAAIDINSQNLTSVGTIGCGAITTSGLFTLNNDIKTDRWVASATNTFLGQSVAGAGNLSGTYNTFIGYQAGNNISSGAGNIAISNALGGLTTGAHNIGVGYEAAKTVVGGNYNICLGIQASQYSAGSYNVCIGGLAGQGASGQNYNYNMYLGHEAGNKTTTGSYNAAIGAGALYYNTSGSSNVVIGRFAGRGATGQAHSNNVFIGYHSAYAITTGGNNVCIGHTAGDILTTGSGNIIIGYTVDPSANNATNEINIGGTLFGKTDTKRVGVNVAAPLAQLHVDQSVADAAIPVLTLDQADVSEEMIEFIGTVGIGNVIETATVKTLSPTHFIKVTIPGGLTRYFQVGTIA